MATVTAPRAGANAVSRGGDGNLIVTVSTYELSSTASGTVIQMEKVQTGDTVVDGFIAFDALGGSTTIDIGDGGATTRWISAVSTASAGNQQFGESARFPYTYTADDTVDAIVGGATATGTLTLVLYKTRGTVDLTGS